jgi:hypothetical protein
MSIKSFLRKELAVIPVFLFVVTVLSTIVYPLVELLLFKDADVIATLFLIFILSAGIVICPCIFILTFIDEKI